MSSEGIAKKERLLKAKQATEKCLASLRSVRAKKAKAVDNLVKKSDANKISKLKKAIEEM